MCLKIVTLALHVTKNVFVYEMAVHISLTPLYLDYENCIVCPIVLKYYYPFKIITYPLYNNTENVLLMHLIKDSFTCIL